MTPSADASAEILADRIRTRQPTLFVRFGDGLVECINGGSKLGHTCDGEKYGESLGAMLLAAVALAEDTTDLQEHSGMVQWGDWRTAESPGSKPQRTQEWEAAIDPQLKHLLHFEALLLMRQSPQLVDFYRAVREDKRRKLFFGHPDNAIGAIMMDADFLPAGTRMLPVDVPAIKSTLDRIDPEVVLFGAGMVGNIPVIQHWAEHQDRTYIALGSALDPLGRGRTRSNQIRKDQAERLFKELL